MDSTKRRKLNTSSNNTTQTTKASKASWTTQTTQQIYSNNLVQALRHVRRNNTRDVRAAADKALAMAAKGRSRWSRAILTNRLRVSRLKKVKRAKVTGKKKLSVELPAGEKKLKVLSRLVPGCRGIAASNVLEEAGDYIAALEMQVRAMAALTELLTESTAAGRLSSGNS